MESISMPSLASTMDDQSNVSTATDSSSTESLRDTRRPVPGKNRWCEVLKCLISFLVGGAVFSLLVLGVTGSLNKASTPVTGTSHHRQDPIPNNKNASDQAQADQNNTEPDIREKIVKGASAPCNPPFCGSCELKLPTASLTIDLEDACQNGEDYSTYIHTNTTPACYNCSSSKCLTYKYIEDYINNSSSLECDGGRSFNLNKKCCLLAAVGNKENPPHCGVGGTLVCVGDGNHELKCKCPHGKTGATCQDNTTTSYVCNCHRDVAGICEDVRECNPEDLYSRTDGRGTCKMNITTDSPVYHCYCTNKTDSEASSLQSCDNLQSPSVRPQDSLENRRQKRSEMTEDIPWTNSIASAPVSSLMAIIVHVLTSLAWVFQKT